MQRDIEQIKAIRNGTKEEQNEFLKQIMKPMKKTLHSYSFLPHVQQVITDCFQDCLASYQEETPALFASYFSKNIYKTLQNTTEEYKAKKKISLSNDMLRYLSCLLIPFENTYLNRMEIIDILGTYKTVFLADELAELKKWNPTALTQGFPNFHVLEKDKRNQQRGLYQAAQNKTVLNENEIKLLKLYLGIEDDLCKDIEEIAKQEKKTVSTVQFLLQSAFKKLEKYEDVKKNFFSEYPNCKEIYAIRKKGIISTTTHPTSKEKSVQKTKQKQEKEAKKSPSKQEIILAKQEEQEKKEAKLYDFLKWQLNRSADGHYNSIVACAKNFHVSTKTIYKQLEQCKQLIETNEAFHQRMVAMIPMFDALWADFLDSRTGNSFSKIQIEIIQLQHYQDQNGKVYTRTYKKIAALLSKKFPLPYTEEFVKRQIKNIRNKAKKYPALKEEVLTLQKTPEIIFNDKNNKTIQSTTFEQKILPLLKAALCQDEDGYYPHKSQLAEQYHLSTVTVYHYFNQISMLLNQPEYYEKLKKEIQNFDVLWQDYIDHTQNQKKLEIINLLFVENEHGTFERRTNQQIAQLLSKNGLHFSENYVQKECQKIYYALLKKEEISQFFQQKYPTIPFYQVKEKRKIESPSYHQEKTEKQKIQKVKPQTKQREEFDCAFLTTLLKQDEHGSFKSLLEAGKELHLHRGNSSKYFKQITKKLQDEAYLAKMEEQIPHFKTLWTFYRENHGYSTLKPIQKKILNTLYYQDENEQIMERTPHEIATLISTDVLHFDEVYVEKALVSIQLFFQKNPEEKKKFQEEQPHYNFTYIQRVNIRRQRHQAPTEKDLKLLKVLLQQDEHGFLPSQTEIGKKLECTIATVSFNIKNVKNSLQNESYHQAVQNEIENFDLLWQFYLDSINSKTLSKMQQTILAKRKAPEEFGRTKYRNNQEVAEMISNDVLHFDEYYVTRQLQRIHTFKTKENRKADAISHLSGREVHLLKESLQDAQQTKTPPSALQLNTVKIIEKLQNQTIQQTFQLNHPKVMNDYYIYWNYQAIPKEEKTPSMKVAHFHLNESYFKNFIALCNEQQKAALSLRLGYADYQIHTSQEVAQQSGLSIKEVELLTTLCVNAGKDAIDANIIRPALQKYKKEKERPIS